MKQETITIAGAAGLHARPATEFSKKAMAFASAVTVEAGGKKANGKSVLTLLTLGAVRGTEVVLTVDGPDEDAAFATLSEFLTSEHE